MSVAEHTAADLARDARQAARALLELGVRKGDPVFIMLPRVPAWYAAMLGVIRIGAIAMPGTNQLTSRDISYRIRSAEAVAAITDEIGAEKIDAIDDPLGSLRHRIAWNAADRGGWADFDAVMGTAGDGPVPEAPTVKDDPMLLFFTSGTVSYPKMVLHPSASYGRGHDLDRALLARPASRRPALDGLGHGLGEGGLGRALRAVRTSARPWSRSRSASPTRTRSCRSSRALGDHVVLRAADALPPARAGRPERLRPEPRSGTARAPASRSTPR